MRTICFYHGADLDGWCAAAVVKIAHPEAVLWPLDYGQAVPWGLVDEDPATRPLVFMVDFCLQPFSDMLRLMGLAELVWIDHHKSAIEAWQQSGVDIRGLRDTNEAGCELAWRYFWPSLAIPRAVRLLGRYDVWDHAIPEVLPFQMGCRAMDLEPRTRMGEWRDLLGLWNDRDTSALIPERVEAGKAILAYQAQQRKRSGERMFVVTVDGLRCLCMNQLGSSQMFDGWFQPEAHDAMLPFGYVPGIGWNCSLYSTKSEVDCSAVAKARGGGGHKGAAGWSGPELPWEIKAAIGMPTLIPGSNT